MNKALELNVGAPDWETKKSLTRDHCVCRICHEEEKDVQSLLAPCKCSGSLSYVHQECLSKWLMSSKLQACEICHEKYDVQHKLKPITSWELPPFEYLYIFTLFTILELYSAVLLFKFLQSSGYDYLSRLEAGSIFILIFIIFQQFLVFGNGIPVSIVVLRKIVNDNSITIIKRK